MDWPASLKEKYLGPAPRPGALPPRQVMAARLLLAGWRVSDVAAHLAVNRHTISAWLKDKQFQEEVRRMAMELPVPVPDFGADEELE